jgi:hypothetical protein
MRYRASTVVDFVAVLSARSGSGSAAHDGGIGDRPPSHEGLMTVVTVVCAPAGRTPSSQVTPPPLLPAAARRSPFLNGTAWIPVYIIR